MPELVVPNIARTPSRSTDKLLQILTPLAEEGMPIEQAVVLASAPFPVAGRATFSHDFGFPRYIPYPHLHEGTDIFADFGTPIVASVPGTVSGIGDTPIGGKAIWIAGDDGASYYYAHLIDFAAGLTIGQRVTTGQVIGYVGNTGDAIGTSPHLHFEIHPAIRTAKGRIMAAGATMLPDGTARSNTPAIDPKPILDAWLRQAEANAQHLVVQLVQRFANVAREMHFARLAQQVAGPASVDASDAGWHSVSGTPLGSLKVARAAARRMSLDGEGSIAERQAHLDMVAEVRAAVDRRYFKFAALTGFAPLLVSSKQPL